MKTKNIISGIFILLVFTSIVSATATIKIEMKDSFGLGDKISFNYTLVSNIATSIQYIASVKCPNAPSALLEIKTANLNANIPLTENYIYISSIDKSISSQTCNAFVSIINPENISKGKTFNITTNPSFNLDLFSCKDQSCSQKANVFLKGENIYLSDSLDLSNPVISAKLTFPDGTKQDITIPSSIKADQIGTYNLDVSASKENYKTQTETLQFGVIAGNANIGETATASNSTSKVSNPSTPISGTKPSQIDLVNLIVIGIIILGVLIILISLIIAIVQKLKQKSITLQNKK